ncbi:hypothetical protein L9F63_022054, partial [Diploptera punctata]
MGLAEKEKNFPRGGRKPAASLPKKGSFSLFGKKSQTSKEKSKKVKEPVDSELKLSRIQPLTRKTLLEGMLVLGCVREINEFKLSISLPGKLIGEVSITNVSSSYTKCLKNLVQENSSEEEQVHRLDDMFRIGQTVVTRVIEIGEKINLSLMPEIVQSEWSSRSLTVGSVIVAAVSSHEEMGYIMETGIKNVRAFLKSSAAEEFIGPPTEERRRVSSNRHNISHQRNGAEVSLQDRRPLDSEVLKIEEFTLDTLLPGTVIKVSVSRVMKNGLEVDCSGHFTGYIHEDHLSNIWDKVDGYSLGHIQPATLLYIMPTVKFAFLSLKKDFRSSEPISLPFDKVKIGDILKSAEVFHLDRRGAIVKLRKNYKGFVSTRHFPKNKGKLEDVVSEDMHVGSKHKCRVLGYDYMTQLFICTLNKKLVKAEYVQPGDLIPGMKVSCEIREHKQKGAFVGIIAGDRTITAFVRSEHMGNVPLKHPEKKFPVESIHPARVLNVEGHKRVQVTLKPKLIESDEPPLCRLEDFREGMKCEGVVMMIKENGLLVTFFNEMQGWLQLKKTAPKDTFYVGQLIKCYVQNVDIDNKKIFLSLERTVRNQELKIGRPYKLTVTEIKDDRLEVDVEGEDKSGVIPAQHLTDNPSLANLLLKTYTAGDVIVDAYCFSKKEENIFTLRPTLIEYFQTEKVCNWSHLTADQLLPCAINAVADNGIQLHLPIIGNNTAFVKSKDLCDIPIEDLKNLELEIHQGLMGRVTEFGNNKKNMTTKLSKCWDHTVEPAVNLLLSFWKDYDKITSYLRKEKNPIAKLKPGDRVKGKVTEVYDTGIVMELKSGVKAVVTAQLCRTQVKCGETVEGTVIYVDYQNNCCELTVCPNIMDRINAVQDGELADGLGVGIGVRGEVLTLRPEMVVIVLKGVGRQQLAYIPTKCHINDVMPNIYKFKVGETCKMIVQAIEGGRIICIKQRFEFELIKMRARAEVKSKNKKKISNNTVNNKLSSPKMKIEKKSHMFHEVENDENENNKSSDEGEAESSDEDETEFNKLEDEIENKESSDKDETESSDEDESEFVKKMENKALNKNSPVKCGLKRRFDEIENKESSDKDETESSDEDESEFVKKLENKALNESSPVKTGFVEIVNKEASDKDEAESSDEDESEFDKKLENKALIKGSPEKCDLKRHMSEEDEEGKKNKKKRLSDNVQNESHSNGQNAGESGSTARLSLSGGFIWDANPNLLLEGNAEDKSDSSDEEHSTEKTDGKKKKKLSKAELREKAIQEERQLRAAEQMMLNPNEGPKSADDFDRLVLSSPNSSLCWIKYMSFHLQATEIEKARAIAQRALSTISFREEQEKLNVWCALLNLENLYGSKESVNKVLEEALRMNEPFKVYIRMLHIYADSNKIEETEELVSTVTKKFRDNKEAWLQCGEVLLKVGKKEKSHLLMQKALNGLEKKYHVEVISKFAHLENRLGDTERAQTLMEHILTSYPKRTDIWLSYVDMLVKKGLHDAARQVLERAVAQKLAVRKMKSLFSKFVQFEEQHGTPESVSKVHQNGAEYKR